MKPTARRAVHSVLRAVALGAIGAALFYGDAMITPAMSVLSATEGLQYVHPGFKAWIVPIAVAILLGLFSIQSRGTDKVGKLFGPRYLGTLFGLTLLSHQVGGFFGAWLGGLALERFGDYTWMWYADMALALIAALANLPIRETSPKAVPAAA